MSSLNRSRAPIFEVETGGNNVPLYLILETGCTMQWVRLSPGSVKCTCSNLYRLLTRVGIDPETIESAAITSYLPGEEESEAILGYAGIEVDSSSRIRDLLVASAEYFYPVDYEDIESQDDEEVDDTDADVLYLDDLFADEEYDEDDEGSAWKEFEGMFLVLAGADAHSSVD